MLHFKFQLNLHQLLNKLEEEFLKKNVDASLKAAMDFFNSSSTFALKNNLLYQKLEYKKIKSINLESV